MRSSLDLEKFLQMKSKGYDSIAICTAIIAFYVHRNSKVTMDQIAKYCSEGNINSEQFLWRAINEHVDMAHKQKRFYRELELLSEIDRLERILGQKNRSLWKRIWDCLSNSFRGVVSKAVKD